MDYVELSAKNQPLLHYLWDISRDWERLRRMTTLHRRLGYHVTTILISSLLMEVITVRSLPPISNAVISP